LALPQRSHFCQAYISDIYANRFGYRPTLPNSIRCLLSMCNVIW
jgi:hypothetical protein